MISSFEYVTVLISIVLGLGITQTLAGVAKLIQKHERITFYWPHLVWVAFILFLHIQEWWVMYELKTFIPWRLPVFLFVMLYPINLYLMAKVVFPDRWSVRHIDLRQFYYQNCGKFFGLLVISAALSLLYNLFILGLKIYEQGLQMLIIVAFGTLLYKSYTYEKLHKAISICILLIASLAVVVEWNKWLIN